MPRALGTEHTPFSYFDFFIIR